MNKKLIRLTEQDLHRIVKESVQRILNEVMVGGQSLHGYYPKWKDDASPDKAQSAVDFNALSRFASQKGNSRVANNARNSYKGELNDYVNNNKHRAYNNDVAAFTDYNDMVLNNGGIDKYNNIADKNGLEKPFEKGNASSINYRRGHRI